MGRAVVRSSNRDNRDIQDAARSLFAVATARLAELIVVGFRKNGTVCHGVLLPL